MGCLEALFAALFDQLHNDILHEECEYMYVSLKSVHFLSCDQ